VSSAKKYNLKKVKWDYSGITSIDGSHSLKDRVPFGYVEYPVRKRKHGRVLYFNFRLAKEMGMIPEGHPHILDDDLVNVLLDTFSLIIINEHDYLNEKKVPEEEIKENRYMATRYLQMQHPNKQGTTSGDGRSMWNGTFSGKGKTWDISSCGTGATCLSPASAASKSFYKSGDPSISYGCGYAQRDEGVTQAVFGEILHRNNIASERTLAVIEYPHGFSVNVRAGQNLLRPSHFFNHLKQGRLDRTKAAIDYYIERQISNKSWPKCPKDTNVYDFMLDQFCGIFSEMAAKFENEYIFCWLDWDGDNILADGGIIDYGSIRQFGLFHKDYRFDDGPRFSTSILEQRQKARYTIQTFAQLRDFLVTGNKKPLKEYSNHKILKKFDRNFDDKIREFLLYKIGFEDRDVAHLMTKHRKDVDVFTGLFHHFERTASARGIHRVADGVTKDVIYCMRDVLRELPKKLLEDGKPFDSTEFTAVAKSSYAKRADLKMSASRSKKIKRFQEIYEKLVVKASGYRRIKVNTCLQVVVNNSAIINRFERVTGNAMCLVVERLLKQKPRLGLEEFHQLIFDLIDSQILDPQAVDGPYANIDKLDKKSKRIVQNYMHLIKLQREGL
jgi:hypothetical protein